MKKIINVIVLSLSVFFLIACSNSSTGEKTSQSSEETKVRLIVKTDSNKTDEKVAFKKGATVMDVLKDNYKVKESGSFITTIDGVTQDKKAGRYWMFDVNDKLASKAADKIKVKNGDKIEFYLKVYKGKN